MVVAVELDRQREALIKSGDTRSERWGSDSCLFLSVAEVAACTGLSTMTVYRRIRSGAWPSARSGRKHLIPRDFVEGLVAEMRATGQINFEQYGTRAWRERTREESSLPVRQFNAFLHALDDEIKSGRPVDVHAFAAEWLAERGAA